MKIAITTDTEGAFVLARNVQRRINEIGCTHSKRRSLVDVYGDEWTLRVSGQQLSKLVNDGPDLILDGHEDLRNRTCVALIQAVEELTQVGFHYHSSVRVIEIPDEIDFKIVRDSNSGESIIEQTRTWFYDVGVDEVHHYDPTAKAWGVLKLDGTFAPFPPAKTAR